MLESGGGTILLDVAAALVARLKLIAEAAARFNNPSFRASLRNAVGPADVARLFAEASPA